MLANVSGKKVFPCLQKSRQLGIPVVLCTNHRARYSAEKSGERKALIYLGIEQLLVFIRNGMIWSTMH